MAERMGLPCSFSGGKRRRDDTRTAGMSLMRELRARAASGSLRHYDPLVDGDVDGCATALHTHYPGFQVLEAGVLPTEVRPNRKNMKFSGQVKFIRLQEYFPGPG